MEILAWLIYAFSALLDLIEKRMIVNRYPMERPMFYTPLNQAIIYISRITLFIISIIAIWYYYDFIIAIIGFIIHMILGLASSKYYYNKKLLDLKKYYYEMFKETFESDKITERELVELSEGKALERVIKNMRCKE